MNGWEWVIGTAMVIHVIAITRLPESREKLAAHLIFLLAIMYTIVGLMLVSGLMEITL